MGAFTSLGWAHARTGHRDEAEKLLRAAIANAGGQVIPTTADFLAEVLAEKGLFDDAQLAQVRHGRVAPSLIKPTPRDS